MKAASPLLNQSCVPAKKTTVPCYYYYKGCCNKGDRCSFLHEPGEFGLNPNKAKSGAEAPVFPLNSKTFGRAATGPIVAEKHSNPSEFPVKSGTGLHGEQKQLAQHSATVNFLEANTSEQLNLPECEGTVAGKTMSFQPAEASFKSESVLSLDSDQCSEELVDGNIVRDEWLESSPSFDILVDGKTEDIVYEDDPEYLHALDGNDGDRERLYMPLGFANEAEYDERKFFDNSLYESSEHFEDELRNNFREYSSRRTRDRKARRGVASKRKHLCEESQVSDCRGMDLRDYLRKRRMADGYLETHDVRHDWLHQVRNGRQEKLQRPASNRRFHGRISSKVERNGTRLPRRKNSVVDTEQRSRPRNSQHIGFRRYNGLKSQQSLTERRSYSKREGYAQDSTFYGLKSLTEIKEDKNPGDFNKTKSVDFEVLNL
ncbi:Zinc finger CCCH domain-containing protein 32 [Bienertia sinuspersici]